MKRKARPAAACALCASPLDTRPAHAMDVLPERLDPGLDLGPDLGPDLGLATLAPDGLQLGVPWAAGSAFRAGVAGAADCDSRGFNSWQGVAPLPRTVPRTSLSSPALHACATRGAVSASEMFYDGRNVGAAATSVFHGRSSGAPHRHQHNFGHGQLQLHQHQLVGEHFHYHHHQQQQPNSHLSPTFGGAHTVGTADVARPPPRAGSAGQWQGGAATSGLHFDGGVHWSGAGPEAAAPHSSSFSRPPTPSPGRTAHTAGPGAATPTRVASPHTAGSAASALSAPPWAHPAATTDGRTRTPPQAASRRPQLQLEPRVRRGAVPSTPESAPASPSGGGADRNVQIEDLTNDALASIDRKVLSKLMEASKLTDFEKSALKKKRRLYKNRISAQGALGKKRRAAQMLEAANGQLVLKVEDLERQNETLRQRVMQLEWHFARAHHAPQGFART